MKRSIAFRIGFFFVLLPFVLMLLAALPAMIRNASLTAFDRYALILAVALVTLTYEAAHTFKSEL